jgi:long-chain acyl-CoA synthetase
MPTTTQHDAAAQQRILDRLGDRTFCHMFMQTCQDHPTRTALVDRDGGTVRKRTWSDYRRLASQAAMGLRALGIDHGDRVAIMANNRPEHVIADVGAMLAGGTPISIYNTFTGDQTAYIANDAEAKVAVVEAEFVDKWRELRERGVLESLQHVVLIGAEPAEDTELTFDDLLARGRDALKTGEGEFENSWRAVEPDDVCTIIYTSGTTGHPKGVQITHRNLMYQMGALDDAIDLPSEMRGVSYLPLAHIAERMVSHYAGIKQGATVEFVPDVKQILESLTGTRPNIMMAVPRVWEKMHSQIMVRLEDEPERRRTLVLKAIENGKELRRREYRGDAVPFGMKLKHALFEKLIFSKLRERLGLDQCEYRLSGAAPISPELLLFFSAIGLEILEVYGMTESTAVITSNRPGKVKLGTVGVPTEGTEVAIAEDGEVLSRGPHITPGYLNRPEATSEAIDDEGWLHTGDLGQLDDDGFLKIIGRKKELIITAGGKNLSPNNIEETIKGQSDIIAQVCAVGDDRPFIGALIVLDAETLPGWCESHGVPFESVAQAAEQQQVRDEVARAVEAGNQDLARVEQVKQWTILPDEWTPESEEMTPTMKLKRTVIHSKYSDMIDSLYGS